MYLLIINLNNAHAIDYALVTPLLILFHVGMHRKE